MHQISSKLFVKEERGQHSIFKKASVYAVSHGSNRKPTAFIGSNLLGFKKNLALSFLMTWLVKGPKFSCTHCSGNLFNAMPLTPPLSPVSKQYQPSPEGQSLNINERRWVYDFSGDWMITEHLRTKRTASLQPCSKRGSSTVGSACSGHCPQILKTPRTEIHRLSGQPAPTLNYL